MNRGIFITVGACLGFMSLIMALFLSRFYTPRELTLDEYKTLGAYFIDPPRQLAEFKLIDDTSKTFLPEKFAGKWNILFFGFTYCPAICPTELGKMTAALNMMPAEQAEKIQPLFITIDPERDTVETMKSYVSLFHPRFIGLTGTVGQIEQIKKI